MSQQKRQRELRKTEKAALKRAKRHGLDDPLAPPKGLLGNEAQELEPPGTGKSEAVLAFWFGALEGPLDVDTRESAMWRVAGEDSDAEILERFGDLVEAALEGNLDLWRESARGSLALVILLDQLTRRIGRGTAAAFAGDSAALELCRAALERGDDRKLRLIERAFLAMPLIHSEDAETAQGGVELFLHLSQEIAGASESPFPGFYRRAMEHAQILRRFGRYPQRNVALNRESTPEEREYLTAKEASKTSSVS